MNMICPYCGALHWDCERFTRSSHTNPKFGGYCLSSKIWLPSLQQPPPELHNLLISQEKRAKKFCTNIRKYNNAFAMTSVGRKLLQNDGGDPFVFKVHSSLSHCIGSLLPSSNQSPVFSQLYIYNPDEALNFHMDNQLNARLNRTIMCDLQDMLHRHHHGATLYKQALELTKDMPPDHQCKIALQYFPGTDCHQYNLPTISGEIAAVVPGTGEDFSNSRDIILYHKEGPLQCISEVHPFYPSLHYVLLFPHGQMGWHPNIPYYVPGMGQGHQETPGRKRLSMREFLAYRFHPRINKSNHIFCSGKLFFEYLVDSWAICEQLCLNYIKKNQESFGSINMQISMQQLSTIHSWTWIKQAQELFFPLLLLAAQDIYRVFVRMVWLSIVGPRVQTILSPWLQIPTGQRLKLLCFQDRDQKTVQILSVVFSMPSGMSLLRTSEVAVLENARVLSIPMSFRNEPFLIPTT